MLLQPGVEGRRGMAEMEGGEALHQGQGRLEGAFGGLPGVGHRPEPSQIEVGVTQHLHYPGTGPFVQACLPPEARQVRCDGGQQTQRVSGIAGLQLQAAQGENPVVMERTAQAQLHAQRLPFPPMRRQRPPAGGVEQIAAMHQNVVHPEFGLIGPPTQGQPGLSTVGAERTPALRAR